MFTKTDIEKYFLAEKSESLFFLVVGYCGNTVLSLVPWIFENKFLQRRSHPAAGDWTYTGGGWLYSSCTQ